MAEQTFVEADIWTVAQTDNGDVVLVRPRGHDVAIPIFIGHLEMQSIMIGLSRMEHPRPFTHDLILSILKSLDAKLKRIEIMDLREKTYYGRIVLGSEAGGKDFFIDARPSDAIGLAVRTICPIFVAESIVEEAGVPISIIDNSMASPNEQPGSLDELDDLKQDQDDIEVIMSEDGELRKKGLPALQGLDVQSASLESELQKAVREENYERAAEIRDKIKDLHKSDF